jgi:nucleoside-diphosphate-sugar epimerase
VRAAIIGANGMIGRKLADWLGSTGRLAGRDITALVLVDALPAAPDVRSIVSTEFTTGDIADLSFADQVLATRPDVIFHLAATVMGQAESDFPAGYRINFDTTWCLLEAARRVGDGYCPRVVYASSTAVYGSPHPDVIPEDFFHTPQSSYGTQKAMSELFLADYSRRGFVDGIGIRLPTICVRPGAPTYGSSGFFSNIIREPLAGREAVLPVPESVRHWFASPRAAVAYLVHAAEIDGGRLGDRYSLTMPGLSATIADAIEALRKIAGERVVRLIRHDPDPAMMAIAAGLPQRFVTDRAEALGFRADALGLGPESRFEDIIRIHIEDDLAGFVAR